MPGSIDKTPVGAPIPAHEQTPPAPVDIKSLRKGAELVERRTENSRTFVTDRGPMVTEFSDQPMHFKAKDGKWQAIDSTLVTGKEPGRIHNKAAGVQVSLPESLTGGPARVSTGGQFDDFQSRQLTAAIIWSRKPQQIRLRHPKHLRPVTPPSRTRVPLVPSSQLQRVRTR